MESVTQSGVTHGAVEVQDCCKLFAGQLHLALNGADKVEALTPRVRPLQPRPTIINAGSTRTNLANTFARRDMWSIPWKPRFGLSGIPTISGMRYCWLPTLPMMPIVSLQRQGRLRGALRVSGMPSEWVAKVAWSQHIRRLASRLFELAPPRDELDERIYDRPE